MTDRRDYEKYSCVRYALDNHKPMRLVPPRNGDVLQMLSDIFRVIGVPPTFI